VTTSNALKSIFSPPRERWGRQTGSLVLASKIDPSGELEICSVLPAQLRTLGKGAKAEYANTAMRWVVYELVVIDALFDLRHKCRGVVFD